MSKKVKKSQESREKRYEKIWRLVNIEGYDYTRAWKEAVPVSKAKKANWGILAKRACDAFEKVHAHDLQKLLEVAGLGLPRVVQEVEKSLTQKKVELFQGKIVKDENKEVIQFEDNAIQQRGRELLTKVHGLEKQQVEVAGTIDITVYSSEIMRFIKARNLGLYNDLIKHLKEQYESDKS